jgi:hypothetical protein
VVLSGVQFLGNWLDKLHQGNIRTPSSTITTVDCSDHIQNRAISTFGNSITFWVVACHLFLHAIIVVSSSVFSVNSLHWVRERSLQDIVYFLECCYHKFRCFDGQQFSEEKLSCCKTGVRQLTVPRDGPRRRSCPRSLRSREMATSLTVWRI